MGGGADSKYFDSSSWDIFCPSLFPLPVLSTVESVVRPFSSFVFLMCEYIRETKLTDWDGVFSSSGFGVIFCPLLFSLSVLSTVESEIQPFSSFFFSICEYIAETKLTDGDGAFGSSGFGVMAWIPPASTLSESFVGSGSSFQEETTPALAFALLSTKALFTLLSTCSSPASSILPDDL